MLLEHFEGWSFDAVKLVFTSNYAALVETYGMGGVAVAGLVLFATAPLFVAILRRLFRRKPKKVPANQRNQVDYRALRHERMHTAR
ncbi:MAG: hypothetical protein AAFQ33_07210 [Pseudomonadota bacterium]